MMLKTERLVQILVYFCYKSTLGQVKLKTCYKAPLPFYPYLLQNYYLWLVQNFYQSYELENLDQWSIKDNFPNSMENKLAKPKDHLYSMNQVRLAFLF